MLDIEIMIMDMKRIVILLLSVMLAVVTYGQSEEVQSKEVYAFVTSVRFGDRKVTGTIDFGDGTPRMYFADDKGEKRNFKSLFEPINLLIKNGWEIDKFSSTVISVNYITHWVVKKKVNENSEVKEGMKLIEE